MKRRILPLTLVCLAAPGVVGCGSISPEANLAIGAGLGTLFLARSPAQEMEQVYYLGVFDPQDQVPPTVYRLTVRGQASAMSGMKFGSGWVHASLIDSLNTSVGFGPEGDRPSVTTGEKEQLAALKTGRRLVMFGPEGFREAPKDHRLVIVMGASPEKFFRAIDSSLELISEVRRDQLSADVVRDLFAAREQLRSEQQRLADLADDLSADVSSSSK